MADDLNGVETHPMIFIIVGRAWENDGGSRENSVEVNVLLQAPDDDAAVRMSLEALAGEGYAEAELDQIGVITEEPDDPTFEGAYADALQGRVAVITFAGE